MNFIESLIRVQPRFGAKMKVKNLTLRPSQGVSFNYDFKRFIMIACSATAACAIYGIRMLSNDGLVHFPNWMMNWQ